MKFYENPSCGGPTDTWVETDWPLDMMKLRGAFRDYISTHLASDELL